MNNIKQTATKVDLWATWCDLVVIGIKAFMGTLTVPGTPFESINLVMPEFRKRRASEFRAYERFKALITSGDSDFGSEV
jgi:hypothetical protein